MSSTVFYSWQSDHPNATNRGFIAKVLRKALRSVESNSTINWSPRFDQATLGTPGSPDIRKTIDEKIDKCDAFVADISIVCKDTSSGRCYTNPNVTREVGYALKSVGEHRVILVLNLAFGNQRDLPFDLITRNSIGYTLSKDADSVVRQEEAKILHGEHYPGPGKFGVDTSHFVLRRETHAYKK